MFFHSMILLLVISGLMQAADKKTPRYLYQIVPSYFLNDERRADVILREMNNNQEIMFDDSKNEALKRLTIINESCNNSCILIRFTPSLFKGVLEYKADPKKNLGSTSKNYYLVKGKIPVEAVKHIA